MNCIGCGKPLGLGVASFSVVCPRCHERGKLVDALSTARLQLDEAHREFDAANQRVDMPARRKAREEAIEARRAVDAAEGALFNFDHNEDKSS